MAERPIGAALAFLAVLQLFAYLGVAEALGEYRPLGNTISNTYAFTCTYNNVHYLFEVNATYYGIWLANYIIPVNLSIRTVGDLPLPVRVRASLSVDGVAVSRVLGLLNSSSSLSAVLDVPLTRASLQLKAEREVKQAKLSIGIDDLRCSFSAQLWVVVAVSAPSVSVSAEVRPREVEVGRGVAVLVSLVNPTAEHLHNVDVYAYVNRSLVYMGRVGLLPPMRAENISISYTATEAGRYVVEVRVAYTSPSAVYGMEYSVTEFVARHRPTLRLEANRSVLGVGEPLFLRGSIEPATADEKVVRLEHSLDGVSWARLVELRARHTFNYTWIPQSPGVHYLRFRLVESRLVLPGDSNIVSAAVVKVRPNVSIGTEWPFVEPGSKARIRVSVSPPVVETVELRYRHESETAWSTTTARVDKGVAVVELLLDRPGIYEVKAATPETPKAYGAESQTIQIHVQRPRTQAQTQQTPTQTPAPPTNTALVAILAAVATAVAVLLLAVKRR